MKNYEEKLCRKYEVGGGGLEFSMSHRLCRVESSEFFEVPKLRKYEGNTKEDVV